jgi:signal transduction histidine kinase
MLGMLRQGDDGSATLLPAPGLAHVRSLVEEYAAAGITTSLVVHGARPPLVPPGVDLCAYRIVQEALTNVAKHAPGAQADVGIRWSAEGVVVEVRDDGHGPALFGPDRGRTAPGQGLLGMRERVGLFGGVLAAGPRPEGGFGVLAQLPFDAPRTGRLTAPAEPVSSA